MIYLYHSISSYMFWVVNRFDEKRFEDRAGQVQGFLRLCFTAFGLPAPNCHPAVWYQLLGLEDRKCPRGSLQYFLKHQMFVCLSVCLFVCVFDYHLE